MSYPCCHVLPCASLPCASLPCASLPCAVTVRDPALRVPAVRASDCARAWPPRLANPVTNDPVSLTDLCLSMADPITAFWAMMGRRIGGRHEPLLRAL